MHDLHLLLRRLADAGVDFVVVGGYAGMIHGSAPIAGCRCVRGVVGRERGKIRPDFADIIPCIVDTSPIVVSRTSWARPANRESLLATDKGVFAIVSSILGLGGFERLRKTAVDLLMFGRTYPLISIEDLIVAKEACGRDKDLLAMKELRAIAAKRRLAEG